MITATSPGRAFSPRLPRQRKADMGLFSWLGASGVSEADIRSEVWSLGARHRGEPLAGALEELQASDLSAERAQLLRACVKTLRRA
jgi:hypothetical protein